MDILFVTKSGHHPHKNMMTYTNKCPSLFTILMAIEYQSL